MIGAVSSLNSSHRLASDGNGFCIAANIFSISELGKL
jgi:hypothetical protein